MIQPHFHRGRHAFSLVELLVVIAIIGIIAGFAVPAIEPVLRGSALTQGGTLIADEMSAARQFAINNNRTVEVRLYRFGDPESPGEKVEDPSTGQFRAIQYFQRTDSGNWLPVSQVQRLPNIIIMNPGERLSTLIGEDYGDRVVSKDKVKADPANNVEISRGVGFNYEYIPFHFLPSGGTDLPAAGKVGTNSAGGLWHVTLHSVSDLARTHPPTYDTAPPSYFCWAVDPVSGTGKVYRPGLK